MWRYTIRDLGPDDDPETWAQQLADEGWRLWIPGNDGADTVVGGRHLRRYNLRRWDGSEPQPAEIPWDRPPAPPARRTGQAPEG